ncbi:hypothetical protein M426DRAFT_37675, partial [Hypoxylon sp. CI-4A]
KVKSGCRTCKARKVKCDEGWPICSRCLSTGRVCEGYGIWGGGGSPYGSHLIKSDNKPGPKNFYAPSLIEAASQEERRHFEWFAYRTAFKLPGVFRFGFWDSLVIQAASDEPAVLHAVLALSSAHKGESHLINTSAISHSSDDRELFTLRHYSKAITHLQPHFLAKSNSSVRIALIACLVFVMMEFLRGHYKAGITHLETGLRLLNEYQARSSAVDRYSLFSEPCSDSIDAWIIQAFIRLDVQAKFLGLGSQYLNIILEDYTIGTALSYITHMSINQARQQLDRLINQVFYLRHQCRRFGLWGQRLPDHLHMRRRSIKSGLSSWYQSFEASGPSSKTKNPTLTSMARTILHIYYTMAAIMIDVCKAPEDELQYDAHTKAFQSMMDKLNYTRIASGLPALAKALHFADMSGSVADLGALPGLYYVATKCRVPRIRNEAVRFLEAVSHKEGIWSAPMAACIARDIIAIEEGDFYENYNIASETSCGSSKNTQLPILPESHRVHDIDVELPEDYSGTLKLSCRRRLYNHNWEMITREY